MNDRIKRYRIEQIGNLSLYEQYEILECFMEDGDRILFHRFNTKLSEIKPRVLERLKNETFEEFCDGILFIHRRELLTTNIMNILSLCKNKYKCEDEVEDLFSKLLVQDVEVINWVEINKIKLLIFDMFYFNNEDLDEEKWIEDRVVYENKY